MSVCKNATRYVLPFLNKTYGHRSNVKIWNIKNGTNCYSTYTAKYLNSPKFNLKPHHVRNIHISSTFNQVISFNLSDIGEGIREVIVKEWYVKEGDRVSQFDNICEVQSDKASVTITSRYDGVITKLYHAVDEIALVGKPLIDIDTDSESDGKTEEPAIKETEKIQNELPPSNEEVKYSNDPKNISNRGFAIPSVRRIAKENKINLTDVKGSGKDGRVLKEDILNHLKTISGKSTTKDADEIQIEPVRGYRRAMIKTMTEAMKIPHFVYHDEICVSNLVKLRELLKQKSNAMNNLKITYMPFFIKATSNALSRYPILNARLDATEENIVYYKSHNIGVAMDTPIGLAVPVIKNVQNKSIIEISKELNRLQDLGRQSKFSQEDLSDGTFTISNIGAIGGTYAKPIILPPQSAILALGSFQILPRWCPETSAVLNKSIAQLSGAADHRIIDGATMARFCNVLKEQIEQPYFLFMDV